MSQSDYTQFLREKIRLAQFKGFEISDSELNPKLKPMTRDIVRWAVLGGSRAIFARFGLHKTVTQLEILRVLGTKQQGIRGIVLPLGVRQEFIHQAAEHFTGDHAIDVRFVRNDAEIDDPRTIYLTNYESVREAKIDPKRWVAASLDEADILRSFGSKTYQEFLPLFDGVPFKYVATATPSPNRFKELIHYAGFLGVMDTGQALTRFFQRDSEKAGNLTLYPHKEREFWLWVASWAVFIQRPSDLGHSDEGYDLPPLDVRYHEVASDYSKAGHERDGQALMFTDPALGLSAAAGEKRDSMPARIAKVQQILAESPADHFVLWHDLEAERHALQEAIPEAVSVWGSQDLEERERRIVGFGNGEFRILSTKPVIAGAGCNFQRHCHQAVFLGIGFKFRDFIQAVHRIQRFGQQHRVRIDLIYTEAERDIRRQLERKWRQHDEQAQKMTQIIRDFGLAHAAMASQLARSLGVERVEASGEHYTVVNNDCVLETQRMESDSVHLVLTSIPFGNQYEYSPSYNDFGHTDDSDHFWSQMDFLLPELYRVLQPGRLAAIHVKDRITPSGISGMGFQVVQPFSDECIAAFRKHGFGFIARKTIVTDVVRENNQTYRLGWTEQCKDGSRQGAGMPEYLLVFRKPPTDRSNGYADVPVVKDKDAYTRPRWQFDAHGFMRSSGNRPLMPEDLDGLDQAAIFQRFKAHSLEHVYDFRHDVKIAEHVDKSGWLPSTFMLLQPQSWHPDVWTDITRMLTLNSTQAAKGREQHICPLQFDIVDRAIEQYTMPGEVVYDPFGGIGTTPYRAIKLGRYGRACELSPAYFLDMAAYCAAQSRDMAMPDLFALLDAEQEAGAA